MGASNDERVNAIADWFSRAGSQVSRMNETVTASKADVKRVAAQRAEGKRSLAASNKLAKAGISYQKGKAPTQQLTPADTLHLINGKVVKGTANDGGILADSAGNPVNNPAGAQPDLSKNDFLDQMGKQRKKDLPGFLGGLSDIATNVAKATPLGDVQNSLFNNSDPLGRPQNFGQWVMNALSTPLYAVAEGAHAVGEAAAQNEAKGLKHDTNPFAPGGAIGSIGTFLGGAGRGVAEGFGARYADHQPRTIGSDLEDLGTKKALQGALGKEGGNVAQGILGGTADVVSDPSTWLTLGAGAAAKGALAGAREARVAAREAELAAQKAAAGESLTASRETAATLAERYAGKAPTPRQTEAATKAIPAAPVPGRQYGTPFQQALSGAKREFNANVLRPTFFDPAKSIARGSDKELKKAWKSLTPDEHAVVNQLPKEDWAQGLLDAAARKKTGGEAFPAEESPTAIPKGLTGVLNPQAADARAASVHEILPQIQARGLDAEQALTNGGTLSDADHAALQQAIGAGDPKAIDQLAVSPTLKPFLDSTIQIGKKSTTVAEVARKLASGDPRTPEYRALQQHLDGALTQAKGRATTVDEPGLQQAFQQQGFAPDLATPDLVQKLNSVPYEARKNLLQEMFAPGRTFKTFDDAMRAATTGQVDAGMMRVMLNRLGIKTRAAKPENLQRLLNGQGKTHWEQIKASVQSPQEVLDIHGIDDSAVRAAENLDLGEQMPRLQEHYQHTVQEEYGYDPTKIAPLKSNGKITGDSTGAAVYEAQRALGQHFSKGEATEAYDIKAATDSHRAITRELGQVANVQGLSGADRVNFMLPRYRQATRTLEASNMANGIMPRLVSENTTSDPLFVSWGQIVDELPDDVLGRALFAPDFGRATFEAEKKEAFRKGFTAYPNVIMAGVHAAVTRGADPESVAIMMRMMHGNISDTAARHAVGDVYAELADVITSPSFVQRMRTLDEVQQPLAYAFSRAAAEGIVTPLSQRVVEAINEVADQGVTRDQLRAIMADARKQATNAAGYPSLVSDMVQQRMDNGFIDGILGEYSSHVLNAQERMVHANRVASAAGGGRKLIEQNKARLGTLDDFEKMIDDAAGLPPNAEKALLTPEDPVEELANLQTKWELMDGVTGIYRTTQRLGVALSGRYVMDGMKDALVTGQTTGFLTSATFNHGLREWLHGKPTGLTRVGRSGGLGEKIAGAKGLAAPVDDAVAIQHVQDWWNALAKAGNKTSEYELIRALRVGVRQKGMVTGSRALEEWEIPEALQLKNFIDQVFNENDSGLFNRSGVSTADAMTELRRFKTFKQDGEFGKMLPESGKALDAQAHIWRDFDITGVNPLDLIDQYFAALSAAGVKPGVGAQVSKLWGRYNPTPEEISQLGLKRLNTVSDKADLARYIDPNAYFTPGERRQLSFLQQAMNYSRDFPEGLAPVVRAYDAVTRVLKSSATVWRPGHHITNILGDMFMNLIAGVNPLHIIRAVKMMRTWGKLLDADMGPLAQLERATRPIGKTVDVPIDGRFGKDFIIVHINGKAQPLSLGEAMQYAHRSGVAMTHAAVMDMAETGPGRTARSRNLVQRASAATIGRADNALAEFSALRDNLTRLPHFISALEKGDHRSLEHALAHAAAEVHDYHPTALAGSGFEQKVLRRAFYFYTWTRQAASRIIRTALDRPGLITIPSKFQYEMASVNGLNPESIGVPIDPNNENIPDYHQTSLLGPTYFGGLTPTPDPTGKVSWGYSLSSPQLDALNSLFQGANVQPGQSGAQGALQGAGTGAYDLVAGNLNPILKAPSVLLAGKDPSDTQFRDVTKNSDWLGGRAKWLADQGGVLTTGAKVTGQYQQAFPGARDPKTGEPYKTPDQQDADAQRSLLNALTGLKFTSYDDATSAAVAGAQRKARAQAAKRAN